MQRIQFSEDLMILENLAVQHQKFGKGSIVAFDGKYMTVRFDAVEKVFVYPDAFERFLSVADGELHDEIVADLARAREKKLAIQNAKAEENLRSMTHGIVIPGKENVPETKSEDGFQNEIEEL